MNVDPHVLAASSAEVYTTSDDFVAAHERGSAVIDPALEGWVGASRVAMCETTARWAASTVAAATRMDEHAHALAVSGRAFAAMDAWHAAHLAAVRAPVEAQCG